MGNRDILAIGTSAGGVEALMHLAKRFRPDFPAAVLVTIHLSRHSKSALDELLTGAGPLKAAFATDGAPLRKSHIYIAPPDRHLLIAQDRVQLGDGARENNARPAIDPMLRSTAVCCCGRSVGVVLTGTLGDGASGLWAVGECGGITVVQDPSDAKFSEMPQNALNRLRPDHVVTLEQMPKLLESLVHEPAGESGPLPGNIRTEVEMARTGMSKMGEMDRIGRRSVFFLPGLPWRHVGDR